MYGKIRGRVTAAARARHDPFSELMIAMCKQAHRDIARARARGAQATKTEIANKFTDEHFLEECRRELAPALVQIVAKQP